jgi:hypothetical protein
VAYTEAGAKVALLGKKGRLRRATKQVEPAFRVALGQTGRSRCSYWLMPTGNLCAQKLGNHLIPFYAGIARKQPASGVSLRWGVFQPVREAEEASPGVYTVLFVRLADLLSLPPRSRRILRFRLPAPATGIAPIEPPRLSRGSFPRD